MLLDLRLALLRRILLLEGITVSSATHVALTPSILLPQTLKAGL